MDPLSITLGVLQLTGTAIKVSSLIYKKLKIFRNYSREVGRVLKAVDRQRQNFLHEIHLLLRHAGQNDEDIEIMLLDSESPLWKSENLDMGVNKALGQSTDTCLDIVEEIVSTLKSLQSDLCSFDEIIGLCSKNEPLKEAIRRLRKQVKITFDKSKFEEQIKTLRELNDDLRRLREQVAEIKKPTPCTMIKPVSHRAQLSQEFGSIGKVRRASKALHQALAAAWLRSLGPTTLGEERHNVKLLLDTPAESEDRMEVVISCHGHQQRQPPPHLGSLQRLPIGNVSLHVESQIVDFMESGFGTPPAFDANAYDSRRKRRKVRFAVEDTQDEKESSVAIENTATPIDLRNADMCVVLREAAVCPTSKCLGFLDGLASETFRHSFFYSPETRVPSQTPVKMSEILARPVETSVNFVEQLKLARIFVLAVLKFHSTPWLREDYSLDDLSFFRSNDGDIADCLQTAHLNLDFVQHGSHDVHAIQMEDVEAREAVETAQLTHGVRNLTLWSLGAALLQIGTWSILECWDDVANVRRLAQRVPMLGKRYRDLTKQCLECDFAFGDDLSKPRLQQAVYENVVCGLTEMISSLDIADD